MWRKLALGKNKTNKKQNKNPKTTIQELSAVIKALF